MFTNLLQKKFVGYYNDYSQGEIPVLLNSKLKKKYQLLHSSKLFKSSANQYLRY